MGDRELAVLGDYFELTKTGLVVKGNPPIEAWLEAGEHLRYIQGSVHWWLGDWLRYGETHYGEKYAQALDETDYSYQTLRDDVWVAGRIEMSRRKDILSFSHHKEVAALEPVEQDELLNLAEEKQWSMRELRKAVQEVKALPAAEMKPGKYKTIVVDPPWPMRKIPREVRKNQVRSDYRSKSVEEIMQFPLSKWVEQKSGCHLYLWTTHKFLPDAMDIMQAWGFNYQCVLTWVKNVGFTPYSWMYSTELCLFGRCGDLPLLKNGVRLDFSASVREHSRKPDEFYEIVKVASPPPRIDVFSRQAREGFDQYGDEPNRFS